MDRASQYFHLVWGDIMRSSSIRILLFGLALCASWLLGGCASREPIKQPMLAYGERVTASQYDEYWFAAARQGRWDILESLLNAGYPVDRANARGFTAVILAAYNGQEETVRQLVRTGADACLGDKSGNTALMGALFKGELAAAKALLDTPCDLNQENNSGETALTFATLFGRYAFMPDLIAHGADPNHQGAHGNTPLRTAQNQGNRQAENALKRLGAD
ncbi:ankyrin repeat domain-containing protein [Cupriavidus sp. 2SB]|uniref:ankyrin repeat domain-containing protein n=1 Tax=Cupriavidus sp. 2SB TaxID=2502199 RepID=UPI002017A6AD|nr:ankyrin repeat domain-containing protein [Cupriavidus sp. 2SB]